MDVVFYLVCLLMERFIRMNAIHFQRRCLLIHFTIFAFTFATFVIPCLFVHSFPVFFCYLLLSHYLNVFVRFSEKFEEALRWHIETVALLLRDRNSGIAPHLLVSSKCTLDTSTAAAMYCQCSFVHCSSSIALSLRWCFFHLFSSSSHFIISTFAIVGDCL